MIEADLRTYLLAQPAVTALIGARLFPLRLPQGAAFPALTYQRVAGGEDVTHQGRSGLGRARMQLDCWAATYGQAIALADAVKDALVGYRGAMGATPFAAGRLANEIDLDEPDLNVYRRMVEVPLWVAEA
jgi:hypothetical protein